MQPIVTARTLAEGLAALGVQPDASLLVHCSMSSFGHVYGGAQAILEALIGAVGARGNIVMPTLTHGRFDPSEWRNPPVPEALWDRIRFETPLFDPRRTPVDHTMSAVYELFRTWPDVVRSDHPHSSVAAWGADRGAIVESHPLGERFGDRSPLGVLYSLDAQVLFLGTTYATNTCFHLAEYRQAHPPVRQFLIVRQANGQRRLMRYEDVDTDSSVFEHIGTAFEAAGGVRIARIGAAECRLFSMRCAVDFAVDWLAGRC